MIWVRRRGKCTNLSKIHETKISHFRFIILYGQTLSLSSFLLCFLFSVIFSVAFSWYMAVAFRKNQMQKYYKCVCASVKWMLRCNIFRVLYALAAGAKQKPFSVISLLGLLSSSSSSSFHKPIIWTSEKWRERSKKRSENDRNEKWERYSSAPHTEWGKKSGDNSIVPYTR